ncbi:MAG: histidine kinase, partial [Chitinophagaceae bacterium]|nr:histidine kinase [Chitinophagaceae bacterium]
MYFHKNSFFVYDKSKLINYKFLISAPKNFYLRNDGILFSAGVTIQSTFLKNANTKNKLNQEFNFMEELPFVDIVEKIKPYPFDKVTIANQRARCIWYDEKEKILWCGFSNGTRFFSRKKEYTFIDSATNMPVVSTCFQQLENGILCIGTIEQGIYFVQNKKIIKQYTIQNGLLSNRIKKMIPYKNMLWFISSKGIQGLNIHTGIFTNFTSSNGLLSNEIFDIEILNHKIYLSTARGLQYFPISMETTTKVAPGILLKNFKVNDSSYQLNSSIQIPYNSTNLSFELLGITLKSRNSFTYEYRLLGIDTNWIKQSSSNHLVRFASLPSGEYIFECRVENEDGIKSKIVQQKFTVQKPWWTKWWFIIGALIVTLSLVYFYLQKKIEAIAKKNNENLEKAKVQEALRNSQLIALKAQMNPHFMFNALNSIQEFIVLNDKKHANFYMGIFADLMRLSLDFSSKEYISLE